MENNTRQQMILEYMIEHHFASIDEIAQHIYVSGATVRRDIEKMEAKGLVRSVYGGVILSEYASGVVPVSFRDRENTAIKEQIAQKASEYIHDNDTVIFDSSSTVRRICRHIKTRKNLTVITNNLRVCQELKDTGVSVYCTGGALMHRRDCFLSHYAEEFLRQITASAVFFSSQGVLSNGDIVDSSEEEIALRKVMLQRAKNSFFLYDSSKLGKEYPFKLCNIADVTCTISDNDIS